MKIKLTDLLNCLYSNINLDIICNGHFLYSGNNDTDCKRYWRHSNALVDTITCPHSNHIIINVVDGNYYD